MSVTSLAVTSGADPQNVALFRCARCGVESPERSCFVIPERYSKPPRDTRCLTCEQQRQQPTTARGITAAVFSVFWPLFIFVGSQRGSPEHLPLSAIVLVGLFYPLAITAHEFGHAVSAWSLRLEVGTIAIGFGRTLRQFRLGGLPIRINTWLLSGRVYLGARSTRFLRTRLWLATLMGPATNAAFLGLTTHYWTDLEPLVGPTALGLWVIVNFFLLLINMMPHRGAQFGHPYRSDGLALLEIPNSIESEMIMYLTAAPLMRAWYRYQDNDFDGSKLCATEALRRAPDNTLARVMLAASLIKLEDYAAAADIVAPIADAVPANEPGMHAMVCNAFAVAILLPSVQMSNQSRLVQAEQLSLEAYSRYPCVLEYRSTRALAVTATGNAENALTLLDYQHYETGTDQQRGHRAAARAFALHSLGRTAEADEQVALAVRLDPGNAKMLKLLGLSTVTA